MRYFLYFILGIVAVVVIYLFGLLVMIYKTYPFNGDFETLYWSFYLLVIIFLLPAMLALFGVTRLLLIEIGYKQDRAEGLWLSISKKLHKQKRWSNVTANMGIGLALYFSYGVFSTTFEGDAFSKILKGEQDELSLWFAGLALAVFLGLFMTIANRWMVW